MSEQDGRASIPQWYRDLGMKMKLSWALALLDLGGSYHDYTIKPLGHILAALYFTVSIIWNFIMGFILYGMIPAVFIILYALVPQSLKDLYWRLIK